jgi:hypothetical protein
MQKRGRPSSVELTLVGPDTITTIRRAQPPEYLSAAEAGEWRRIVGALPADWFPVETHGLLESYCAHLIERRDLTGLIAAEKASPDFTVKQYNRLLAMRERESRAISSLATRMRISQQATLDRLKKKDAGAQLRKPWEDA